MIRRTEVENWLNNATVECRMQWELGEERMIIC